MPKAPPTFRPPSRGYGNPEREYDRARGSSSERLYDWRWSKASKAHLRASPLCRYCALENRVGLASEVDHLYPHRGDIELFWRREFWISTCKPCHSGMKQTIERAGRTAIDALALRLGINPSKQ